MDDSTKRLLYWAPRVITVSFALFLSLFAMDVFDEKLSFWNTALALFMHLIPTWIVLLFLWLVWRREWIALIVFPPLAALHLWWGWGRFDWTVYLIIDAPPLVLAALFWVSWKVRTRKIV